VATVLEQPNDLATPPIAAAWMLEQKVMIAVMKTTTSVDAHFLLGGQFVGCSWGRSLIWGAGGVLLSVALAWTSNFSGGF